MTYMLYKYKKVIKLKDVKYTYEDYHLTPVSST